MAPPSTETVRILIVDDEQDLRRLIRHRLERTGWCTVIGEAADTADTIRLAEAEQPDVVLLDLLLGAERGIDAIGELLRVAPQAMVAALTVLSAEDQEEAVKVAGAFAFYEKTMLADLPDHLGEDLPLFRRAITGDDVLAPSAVDRRT